MHKMIRNFNTTFQSLPPDILRHVASSYRSQLVTSDGLEDRFSVDSFMKWVNRMVSLNSNSKEHLAMLWNRSGKGSTFSKFIKDAQPVKFPLRLRPKKINSTITYLKGLVHCTQLALHYDTHVDDEIIDDRAFVDGGVYKLYKAVGPAERDALFWTLLLSPKVRRALVCCQLVSLQTTKSVRAFIGCLLLIDHRMRVSDNIIPEYPAVDDLLKAITKQSPSNIMSLISRHHIPKLLIDYGFAKNKKEATNYLNWVVSKIGPNGTYYVTPSYESLFTSTNEQTAYYTRFLFEKSPEKLIKQSFLSDEVLQSANKMLNDVHIKFKQTFEESKQLLLRELHRCLLGRLQAAHVIGGMHSPEQLQAYLLDKKVFPADVKKWKDFQRRLLDTLYFKGMTMTPSDVKEVIQLITQFQQRVIKAVRLLEETLHQAISENEWVISVCNIFNEYVQVNEIHVNTIDDMVSQIMKTTPMWLPNKVTLILTNQINEHQQRAFDIFDDNGISGEVHKLLTRP